MRNNFSDNHILKGDEENAQYSLVSPIQIEKGPRLLFPHFGFYYRATNTRVKVIFLETASNTQHEIMNTFVNTINDEIETENEWKYFFKNISEVDFISTAWEASEEVQWQVHCGNQFRILSINSSRYTILTS